MELNREQIIKALECWASRSPCHEKCSILEHEESANCIGLTTRSALSLIKELTEENENWKAIAEGYQKQFEDCAEDRARLTEENEAWQKQLISQKEISDKAYYELACEVEDLRAENERLREHCKPPIARNIDILKATTKADTVRKMQEEIKERCIKGGIYPAFVASTIDQIAKEMLEGENED